MQCDTTYWSGAWLTEVWHGLLKCGITQSNVMQCTEVWPGLLKCDKTRCSVTQLTEVWHDLLRCDIAYWMWHNLEQCDAIYRSGAWLTEVWHGLLKCDTTYWSESERMPLQSGNTGAVQEDVLPWVGPEAFPLHLQLKDTGWMSHNLSNTKCMQVTFLWHGLLHQLFF